LEGGGEERNRKSSKNKSNTEELITDGKKVK
jgi:hypothetical protein